MLHNTIYGIIVLHTGFYLRKICFLRYYTYTKQMQGVLKSCEPRSFGCIVYSRPVPIFSAR